MTLRAGRLFAAIVFSCTISSVVHAADNTIQREVDGAIRPLMKQYAIAGMAVGVIADGKPYVFNYGLASVQPRTPVTRDTLFELGSISKTFTATLAAKAQIDGYLSLSDRTSKYLPVLQNTPFGDVTLLNLGTHTPGGLPLQVPDNVNNNDELMQYFRHWKPAYAAGTYRTYANPGIGTLGLITAKSMDQDFDTLMTQRLFPALGLKSSYMTVPAAKMKDYAEGYTKDGAPIRVKPGVLSSEAYGVKSTAADMLRFLQANMNLVQLDPKLQRAITDTHTGYFQAGPMTQDLIWEQYPYPVALDKLLEGNAPAMILNATPVTEIRPPQPPRNDVWINKTGATNGFGAYVAFIPQRRLGIVMLANKNVPNDARVKAAYRILESLAKEAQTQ
jgi:beta-lactamase class C